MKRRILVIDDNLNLTNLLSRVLYNYGFETFVENNSFLSLLALDRADPQLLILDLMMPGKDGAMVLAELRATDRWSQLPVILLTAMAQEAHSIVATIGGQHCGIMGKPVELDELVEEIESRMEVVV